MTIFDIMGPVMVGPSSSHTAGAVRIGLITRRLLGGTPVKGELLLHGSFAATGAGHGTDRALVAGLLGMYPDDEKIPHSLAIAQRQGVAVTFGNVHLRDAHPNTVVLKVWGADERGIEVTASSLGGGRVRVTGIDGLAASFSGEMPTLIIRNEDKPGCVAEITTVLFERKVNIATMQLYRDMRGGLAVMVIESDQPMERTTIEELKGCPGVMAVTYLDTEGREG